MTRYPTGVPLTAAARQERARKVAQDGEAARAEQQASSDATEAKTLRLRALRLERERSEAEEAAAIEVKKPPKKASKTAKAATPKVIRRRIPLG